MKNRFDLIIFDWDGTLVDSIDWIVHCIQQAAVRNGCEVPAAQAAKDIIGLSIEEAVKTLFPDADADTRRRLAADYGQGFFSRNAGPDDLFPGVRVMLEQFRSNGYRLAVATGKKSAGLAQAMAATGVTELFDVCRCSDQTASKPDPLMLNQIMAELGIDPARTLMVGDSIHDMQMAVNAGIPAIGVTCGAHSAETLRAFGPLLCLDYPTDLPAHFC